MEELLALLANESGEVDEEALRALMESGLLDEEQGLLDQQTGMAQALRGTPMPEMRGNGRVMVAANPLEFLAAGASQLQGQRQLDSLGQQNQALLDKTRGGAADFLIRYLRRGRESSMPQQLGGPGVDY